MQWTHERGTLRASGLGGIVANFTTTGTTGYPGTIDTRTALTDGAAGDQIVANHPNGLGAAVLAIETELGTDPAGTVADVKTRLDVSQNSDGTIKSSVIAAGGGAGVSYSSGVFTISWSPDGPAYTQNLGLEVTANAPVSNALRIRIVQRSGATPTSTSPVRLGFKVATASAAPANGGYVVREITSDTAFVLSSGSSLGTAINETARVYVIALDSNGTVEAGAYNPKAYVATTTAARVTQLFRPSEAATYTTTAEGGAGGADTAATLYSTSARTGVYLRRLGYFDVTLGSTVGNWSNNPTDATVIGPGTPITGDVIQEIATHSYANVKTTTNTTPNDGTIPQIGEGAPGLWATMTHTKAANCLKIDSLSLVSNAAAGWAGVVHVHRNSEADALLTAGDYGASVSQYKTMKLNDTLATTTFGAPAGYYLIYGADGNTTTFGGQAGINLWGQSQPCRLTIKEICA